MPSLISKTIGTWDSISLIGKRILWKKNRATVAGKYPYDIKAFSGMT